MTLDPERAKIMGQIGMARRWAKTVTPEARRDATAAAREAQYQAWVARARAMPGLDVTAGQLHESALRLRAAHLAGMRLKRLENRRRAA